jgi:lipoprotein-anchoring transpeptidase ErfK/SrfK
MPVVNVRGETFDEDSYYNAEITAELLSDDYPVFDEDTVKDIQRALNKYLSKHLDGFEELSIDGKFGPATAKAVKDYQRLKKMTVDGVVGPATAKALGVSIDQNVFYAPRLADAFERSKNGMAAHLNLRTHLLEIYQMGSYGWELIDIMTCSTGNQKKGYYTPVGIFVLDGESHNVISGDGWEAVDATKIVYIKGEGTFLFHSVLRDPKTGKFDSNSTLGKSITHGCVRLSRENATWVRENLTKGTVVVIDDRNWDNSAMIGQNH